jgi:hypothetical protein
MLWVCIYDEKKWLPSIEFFGKLFKRENWKHFILQPVSFSRRHENFHSEKIDKIYQKKSYVQKQNENNWSGIFIYDWVNYKLLVQLILKSSEVYVEIVMFNLMNSVIIWWQTSIHFWLLLCLCCVNVSHFSEIYAIFFYLNSF